MFFILSYILFGLLKNYLAAWIDCKSLIELLGRPDITHTCKKNKILIKYKINKTNKQTNLLGPRNPELQPICMNNLLTTTALLNIHFLPAGGAFGTVSTVTAEHKTAHWTLKCAVLIFMYSFLSLIFTLSFITILVGTQL